MFKETKVHHERAFLNEEGLDAVQTEINTLEHTKEGEKKVNKSVVAAVTVRSGDDVAYFNYYADNSGQKLDVKGLDALILTLQTFRSKLVDTVDHL